MLKTTLRLLWLPVAFLISAIVALFVLVTLGQERLVQIMSARGEELADLAVLMRLAGDGAALIAGITLIPAILVVIVGEAARIRS
ncbi:MAG: hypothetical protein AAGG72_08760, partial [Pseudomonadota bacterium]